MGNVYTITMPDQTMSGPAILIGIRPAAATGFRVLRAGMSQRGTETADMIGVQLGRKAAAFPTLTSGVTPAKVDEKDAVSVFVSGTALAAGTCGIYATSEGAGTFTPVVVDCFNNTIGWQWVAGPKEEMVFRAGSADAFVMRTPGGAGGAAPVSTANWTAFVVIEEI